MHIFWCDFTFFSHCLKFIYKAYCSNKKKLGKRLTYIKTNPRKGARQGAEQALGGLACTWRDTLRRGAPKFFCFQIRFFDPKNCPGAIKEQQSCWAWGVQVGPILYPVFYTFYIRQTSAIDHPSMWPGCELRITRVVMMSNPVNTSSIVSKN